MNKTEFVARLAQKRGTTKVEAQRTLEAMIDIINEALDDEADGEAWLPSIGKLHRKNAAARTARSPQTQEIIQIPAASVIRFSASKGTRRVIEG